MWAKFKLWILRGEIDRYLEERNLSDLFIEIEYRRHRKFNEDNHADREAFYREHFDKARDYIHQRFLNNLYY